MEEENNSGLGSNSDIEKLLNVAVPLRCSAEFLPAMPG